MMFDFAKMFTCIRLHDAAEGVILWINVNEIESISDTNKNTKIVGTSGYIYYVSESVDEIVDRCAELYEEDKK